MHQEWKFPGANTGLASIGYVPRAPHGRWGRPKSSANTTAIAFAKGAAAVGSIRRDFENDLVAVTRPDWRLSL
jgi:hypothetical protein